MRVNFPLYKKFFLALLTISVFVIIFYGFDLSKAFQSVPMMILAGLILVVPVLDILKIADKPLLALSLLIIAILIICMGFIVSHKIFFIVGGVFFLSSVYKLMLKMGK